MKLTDKQNKSIEDAIDICANKGLERIFNLLVQTIDPREADTDQRRALVVACVLLCEKAVYEDQLLWATASDLIAVARELGAYDEFHNNA